MLKGSMRDALPAPSSFFSYSYLRDKRDKKDNGFTIDITGLLRSGRRWIRDI